MAACGEPGDSTTALGAVSESDSSGVAVVKISGALGDLPVWSLASDPVLELRGDAPPFFGRIGEVAFFSDGRLLVEDDQANALYVLDAEGADFGQLGAEGDGPGEFRDLTALSITAGDTAYAYDRRLNRITAFDPGGSVLRSISVDAGISADGTGAVRAWVWDPDRMLLHGISSRSPDLSPEATQRDQRDVLLIPLDGAGRSRGPGSRFKGGYTITAKSVIVPAPFANVPIIAVGRDRVVHASGLDYELVVTSPELTVVRIIRWSGWDRPLSEAMISSVRAAVEPRFADLRETDPESADLIVDAMFEEDLLPSRLPALGSALLDDQDRIWVARFLPISERWAQVDSWHVLTPDGAPLARVRLPENSRLVAVSRGRVALVTRDELDLEHVRVFPLEQN